MLSYTAYTPSMRLHMQCLLLKEKNRKGEQRRRGKKEGRDKEEEEGS